MVEVANSGPSLLAEIESAVCPVPSIWWLGHAGFVLKYRSSILYVDPFLSDTGGQASGRRLVLPPLDPACITHAGLILCTHPHPHHLDERTVGPMLAASPKAKLVVPKTAADYANRLGISYHRMVTTDSNLRVEYLDDRIYAVPSAHDSLDWTPLGGYPHLGYLIRFGRITIYHAGDCVPYPDLADRLRPYTVNVALLPITGRKEGAAGNFDINEAAQLAEDIGAEWLVPMHYGVFDSGSALMEHFIEHMLGHRPLQRFKMFRIGEQWPVVE